MQEAGVVGAEPGGGLGEPTALLNREHGHLLGDGDSLPVQRRRDAPAGLVDPDQQTRARRLDERAIPSRPAAAPHDRSRSG